MKNNEEVVSKFQVLMISLGLHSACVPVDPGGGEGDDPEEHQQSQAVHPAADVRQKVHDCSKRKDGMTKPRLGKELID